LNYLSVKTNCKPKLIKFPNNSDADAGKIFYNMFSLKINWEKITNMNNLFAYNLTANFNVFFLS
jgi:hypothetical protein